MKQLIATTVVLFAMSAFADHHTAAPATTETAPAAAPAEAAAPAKKMNKKTAMKECKAQKLKGKELAECVKTKTM